MFRYSYSHDSYNELYSFLAIMEAELHDWKSSLPPSYSYDPSAQVPESSTPAYIQLQ
jgi:hypothetical protein